MMRMIAFPVPSSANAHRGIGSRAHGIAPEEKRKNAYTTLDIQEK